MRAKITELEAIPRLTSEQQKLLDKLNAKEAEAAVPKDPDFLEDPKGYVDTKLTKAQDALKKLEESNTQQVEQRKQQAQFQELVSNVGTAEASFIKTAPDYYEAINHMRGVRTEQLKMIYPQATPQQIAQQIAREEIGAAAQVLQAGGNPAEWGYRYAKTMGYVPKAMAAATAAKAAATETKPDKDAVRTLGGGGGDTSASDEDTEDGNMEAGLKGALMERFGARRK